MRSQEDVDRDQRIVIAMRPRYAGEARQAILSALSSNIRPKWVVVADSGIDVHDSAEVEWAMSFRVQPRRDIVIFDQMPRGGCDPSVPNPEGKLVSQLLSSAVSIDATCPSDQAFPEVADVPDWRDYELSELNIKPS